MPPGLIEELFRNTHQKLSSISRQFFSLRGLRFSLSFLFYLSCLFFFFILLELLFELIPPVRLSFWIIAGLAGLFFIIHYLYPSLRQAFRPATADFYQISKIIGKKDVQVQDSLIDFLQIYQDESSHAYPAFKYVSLNQLYKKFKDANFHTIIDFRILNEPAKRLLIIATVFFLLFILFPQSMNKAALKVLYPTREFETARPTILDNKTRDKIVLKNEEIVLEGAYEGIRPHKLWLLVETANAANDSIAKEKLEVPLSSGKNFSYKINHVKNSFSYWFEANIGITPFNDKPISSAKGKVNVKDRPYIRDLRVTLKYPGYTGLPDYLLPPNDGEISALTGTSVNIEIEANKALTDAKIVFSDSNFMPLKITENRASGKFTVKNDDEYQIKIFDGDSISNYQPVQYSIFALQDENPFVEIAEPGQDLDLEDELEIPLLVNLRDDYGFTKLSLKGRVIRAGSTQDTNAFDIKVPYQYLEKGKAISEYKWDLHPFYLIPEDYIEYFAEVFDNDVISGPKTARSETFILRLPSIMEVIESSGQEMSEQLEKTDDATRESRELRKKLEEISREMKRENELTWERKKELKEQVENQKETLKKLEDVQKDLEEIVNELDRQNMLSPETLEKYFELQKMFQDLASPEMMEAMNKLQEALEKADMEEVKKSLEEFRLSMEEFEKSVERTYELFKQVQLEQKMDELTRLAEKITEDQKQINKNLEDENADKGQLGKKESNLGRETDFLKEKMEDTSKEFEDQVSDQLRDLQKAGEFMEQQQISQQMQQMQQQLSQGDMQQAKQSGKDIQQQMEMLQSMLQQAQQSMAQMQKKELNAAMQKVTQDMLQASYQQENLFDQSNRTDIASSQINEIAKKQSQLQEDATGIIKQLIDISQKTFFMSPQMNQIMSSMMQNMDKSLGNLENRNLGNAAKAQQDAMGDLNRAILSMQSSMNQLSQSASASGFEQFMQQLQQMSGQQGQINQQSMSLLQQSGQGKMQLSEDALARLAAQQEMIRQSLEQLNQQGEHQGNVLGRLDELGKEMEEVVKKLQQQQLNRKVIERQERILSRLLDAQKSIREKEYSKKRQAEREDKIIAKSPPELKQEIMERENELQKELIQSLKEGYSSEYKDYIKLYYEILSRRSLDNSNN